MRKQIELERPTAIKLAVGACAILVLAALICLVFLIKAANQPTSKINNQNPTGCAYGDSIPVDSEKCSAETFRDKSVPATQVTPTVLPSVGGSGK